MKQLQVTQVAAFLFTALYEQNYDRSLANRIYQRKMGNRLAKVKDKSFRKGEGGESESEKRFFWTKKM